MDKRSSLLLRRGENMNLLYYVIMVITLTVINSFGGFELAVTIGLALILLNIQELKDELKKKDGDYYRR